MGDINDTLLDGWRMEYLYYWVDNLQVSLPQKGNNFLGWMKRPNTEK